MDKHLSINGLDYYHVMQPIVDLPNNKVFGYEMLLRSKEIKSPEMLFKIAEKQNLLFELDMHSIQKAFETMSTSVSTLDGFHLFINILPSTIGNPLSKEYLTKLKANLKLKKSKIVFEITEAKKEKELMMCKKMVGDMKEQDFLIALDDLGKGDFENVS